MYFTIKTKFRQGFTLVELLVVISIIALLLAILMPALSAARSQSQRAICKAGMHQIGIAMSAYTSHNQSKYPMSNFYNYPISTIAPEAGSLFVADVLKPYIKEMIMFLCPANPGFAKGGWVAEYKAGRVYRDQEARPFIGYNYFGNYPYEYYYINHPLGVGESWLKLNMTRDELALFKKGLIYPTKDTGKRCKLFQDVVSYDDPSQNLAGLVVNRTVIQTSHESPNSLYTDGSVMPNKISELTLVAKRTIFGTRW